MVRLIRMCSYSDCIVATDDPRRRNKNLPDDVVCFNLCQHYIAASFTEVLLKILFKFCE